MSSPRLAPTLSRTQSALTWLLAGLVFALGLLAVSPSAHAHLHDSSSAHHHDAPFATDDAGCAITLFGHGITTPIDLPRITTPRITWTANVPPARDTLAVSAPRHLLWPARGPPYIG
ncbi:hypothetical protein [Rariglobus hedericola]|uniref:Uncharacterized protein n=1 Tax=Rariglobus hedericola TaxID=2597822 RepID=A0A556QKG9_9BACT|nr:hypothetical protein [Rariglobus hedericola]TSJ77144.1 hypothetical protein FPL22_13660 [Rariglobus hedericola]